MKMNEPAGIGQPVQPTEAAMMTHLFLLLLIVVIMDRKIKITIEKQ
jgi:hypothetical protein